MIDEHLNSQRGVSGFIVFYTASGVCVWKSNHFTLLLPSMISRKREWPASYVIVGCFFMELVQEGHMRA